MRFKILMVFALIGGLLVAGCASKGYVDQRIAEVQAEMQAEMNTVKAQTALNADEIKRMQALTAELSDKADMALNEAKGFENYQVIWEGVVNFNFDSHELTQISRDYLEELGQKMIDYPRSLLEMTGHTDKTGPADYNLMLGKARAEAVQRYLVDQYGIALYRMFIVSQGENRPVAMGDERDANAKNRRVVLKLWGRL
jgi:outer membrane protein OmpA-like peptidoglycan-associated protein